MKFFVLGSHPSLSLAELSAVLGTDTDFSLSSKEVAVVEPARSFADDRFGGIIKHGEVIGSFETFEMEALADFLFASVESKNDVAMFGVSVYDGGNQELAVLLAKQRDKIGLATKKRLKDTFRRVRYVTGHERALPSVAVVENDLVQGGGEFVLIATKQGLMVGKTSSVQDFAFWSKRDYGRPARDPKSGMLPPKLARMMINFSGVEPATSALLDPFCGSGTILMEAVLLGFPRLIGGDISKKAIADSKRNLDWLQKEINRTVPVELIETPAHLLPDHVKEPIDAIVGEGYLGPKRSTAPDLKQAETTLTELRTMYSEMLPSFHALLKQDGTVVLAIPAYQTRAGLRSVDIVDAIKKAGFLVADPFAPSVPERLRAVTPQGGLLYARPGQFVSREILLLKRQP